MERVFIDHLILYTLFGVTTVWIGPVYRDQFYALLHQVNGAKDEGQIEFWVPPIALDLVLPEISIDAADAEDWLQQLRSQGLKISEVYEYRQHELADDPSPEASIKNYVSQTGCALLTCHAQRYQDIDSPAIVLSLDACPTVAELSHQLEIRRRLTRLYTNPSLGQVVPIDRSPPSGTGFVTTGFRPQPSVGGFPLAASLVLLVAVVNYLDFCLRSQQKIDWQQAHRSSHGPLPDTKILAEERDLGLNSQPDWPRTGGFFQPAMAELAWEPVPVEPGSISSPSFWLLQESWSAWTGQAIFQPAWVDNQLLSQWPEGSGTLIAAGLTWDRDRSSGLTGDRTTTDWQQQWRGVELLVPAEFSIPYSDAFDQQNAWRSSCGAHFDTDRGLIAGQPSQSVADADSNLVLQEPIFTWPMDHLPRFTPAPFSPVDPLPVYEAGVFETATGAITIDFLFDGGADEGQLGIFNLDGLELYNPGSLAFRQAVVERVLSRSDHGHIVIADRGDELRGEDGARFTFPEVVGDNLNLVPYRGAVTFTLPAGTRFGFVLLPNGTFRQLQAGSMANGYDQLLFSLRTRSPDSSLNTAQVREVLNDPDLELGPGQVLGWEDRRVDPARVRDPARNLDYNDLVIRVNGAAGIVPNLDRLTRGDDVWWPLRFPGRVPNSTSPVPQSGLD